MKDLIEIRWHGRGGQGAKTASLLLADAAFNTGKYIQGFPEYGPERTGAPLTAYNRISTTPIRSHSNVYYPDYVVVVDDTLLEAVPVAQGIRDGGRMSLSLRKLNVKAPYKSLPEHLDVDVTALTIGKSIKVGQLSYEGLELVTGKDVVVCSIKMTRAASMAAQAAKEGK